MKPSLSGNSTWNQAWAVIRDVAQVQVWAILIFLPNLLLLVKCEINFCSIFVRMLQGLVDGLASVSMSLTKLSSSLNFFFIVYLPSMSLIQIVFFDESQTFFFLFFNVGPPKEDIFSGHLLSPVFQSIYTYYINRFLLGSFLFRTK